MSIILDDLFCPGFIYLRIFYLYFRRVRNCRTKIGVMGSVVITRVSTPICAWNVLYPIYVCVVDVCALEVKELEYVLLCLDTASRRIIVLILVTLIVLYGCFDI